MTIQFIFTAAGKAALVNDQNTGTNALAITTIAIGTGTRVADGTETALLTQAAISNFIGNADAATKEIAGSGVFTGTPAINATEVGIFAKIGSGAEFLFLYWSTTSGDIGFRKIAGQTGRLAVAIKFDTPPAASITFSNTAPVTFSNTFVQLTDTSANIQPNLSVVGNTVGNALEFSSNLVSNQLYYYLPTLELAATSNPHDISIAVPSDDLLCPISVSNDMYNRLKRYERLSICFIERPTTAAIKSGTKVRGVYHGIITSTLYLENATKNGWVFDDRARLTEVYLSVAHNTVVLTCNPPPSDYRRCIGFIDSYISNGVHKIFIDTNSPVTLLPHKLWEGNSSASRTITVSNWKSYTTLTATAERSHPSGVPYTPFNIPIPIFASGVPVVFTEVGSNAERLILSYSAGDIKVTSVGATSAVPRLVSVWLS